MGTQWKINQGEFPMGGEHIDEVPVLMKLMAR